MARVIENLWLRIERAQDHLRVLESETSTALRKYADGAMVGKLEPQTGDYIFSVLEPLPAHWGLLAGEIAHQARSTLDNLVWALIARRGNEGHHGTTFVIADTEASWDNARCASVRHRDALDGLSAEDQTIIQRLQPYLRADPPLSFAQSHPLSQLRWLSNEDKHRLLHPALLAWHFEILGVPSIAFDPPIGGFSVVSPPLLVVRPPPGPILAAASNTDSAELMRLKPRMSVENIGPKVRVYFKDSLHVGFAHASRLVTVSGLGDVLDEVRLVVRLFEPEFS